MKTPETPAEAQVLANNAELVMRGMINAAKADGEVSAEEIMPHRRQAERGGHGPVMPKPGS